MWSEHSVILEHSVDPVLFCKGAIELILISDGRS